MSNKLVYVFLISSAFNSWLLSPLPPPAALLDPLILNHSQTYTETETENSRENDYQLVLSSSIGWEREHANG